MLIDTHTHLESFARKGELPGILDRARAAGVSAMVTIGTDTDDWELYRGIAASNPGFVHYTAGLHPCSVGKDWAERVTGLERYWRGAGLFGATALPSRESGGVAADGRADMALESQATSDRDVVSAGGGRNMAPESQATTEGHAILPVALGETGLDRFHLPKDDTAAAERILGWQRAAFAEQMRIATQVGCPLVVHSRGAFRECVEMIDAAGVDWAKVVFHCFTEGPAEMRELLRRGGYGSFTGIITYKTADAIRAAALEQGLDRLMLETDAPYLTPMPHRGKPNEPGYVRHTAEFCAGLFGVSLERLAEVTTANARRFFGFQPAHTSK